MAWRVRIQGKDALLRSALKGGCVGDAYSKTRLSGAVCLANGAAVMIEHYKGSNISGESSSSSLYLYRTAELLRILGRGDGYATGRHVCDLPDAAVRIEFQAAQRELDGRAASRWIF